jgi:Leucine-rich repeat (LRR) protein
MNDLDDRVAAKRKERKKTKSKKKRRPSPDEDDDIVIGQLKSPPELLITNNQASKFSGSSVDSSLSSKGKSSKDGSSGHYVVSVANMPSVAKMPAAAAPAEPATKPGAFNASFEDLSAAERLKFGMVSTEMKPATMPGAFSASNEDLSAAERLKFGMASTEIKPAARPGAFSASNENLSAAERLKFGIVSNAEVTQVTHAPTAPGIYPIRNEDLSAAERLKFGIAQPVPVVSNNQQESGFSPKSEYEQSYTSNLTNDYWGTQPKIDENGNAVIEAEVVSDHDNHDDFDDDDIDWFDGELLNWRNLCAICSVVSFIIIISLSAALNSAKNKNTVGGDSNDLGDNNGPQQPLIPPTPSPFDNRPVDISWCSDSKDYVADARYASLQSTLVASGLSTDAEFATDNSYQRKALCWLAFGDALQVDISDPFIEQRYALATLFYSLNEPSKLLTSGWLSGRQECKWTPIIECDVRTGSTVSKLNISGFDLQGQLPKELSTLRYVTHLDLSNNLLNGGVTKALSGWSVLQEVTLANNSFETVPELVDVMSSITYFDVSGNNIAGEIPVFLAFASNLAYVDISSNSFSGNIPDYMGGNLPQLYSLYMHSNDLTGKMPQSICNLRNGNLINLSVDCGAEEGSVTGDVSCDVPQCCTVCNGYV